MSTRAFASKYTARVVAQDWVIVLEHIHHILPTARNTKSATDRRTERATRDFSATRAGIPRAPHSSTLGCNSRALDVQF